MLAQVLTVCVSVALWLLFATDPHVDPTDGAGITWPEYAGADSQTLVYLATDDEFVHCKLGRLVNDLCE